MRRHRFSDVVPAYPAFNIYSRPARVMTAPVPLCSHDNFFAFNRLNGELKIKRRGFIDAHLNFGLQRLLISHVCCGHVVDAWRDVYDKVDTIHVGRCSQRRIEWNITIAGNGPATLC